MYETDQVPAGYKVNVSAKITQRQREFLLALLEQKDLTGVDEGKLDLVWKSLRISEDPEEFGMSKQKASELIEWLLKRNDKPRGGLSPRELSGLEAHSPGADGAAWFGSIPAGRYAVENEEGILRFYSVDRPKEGKWAGYVFVSVWASDERHPIKGKAAKAAILEKIEAAGPKEAAERFGREIGSCAICGRTLTDPTSISIGIGPVCRQNSDWY